MDWNKIPDKTLEGCATAIMKLGVIVAVIWLLCSCKHIEYVSVPEVHTDTLYISKTQHDSVYVKDSVYLHEYTKGDTIFIEKMQWHTKWRERLLTDTIYRSKVDSVAVPYPVQVVKTNYAGWWAFGGLLLFIAAVVALFIIIRKRE